MGVGDGSSSPTPSSWRSERCRSTGATMSVTTPASRCCCCCCINIYVNNNVQGVTNSVLVGSKVVMRDPAARVVSSSRHPRRAGRFGRGKQPQQKKTTTTWAAAAMVCVAIAVLMLGVMRM